MSLTVDELVQYLNRTTKGFSCPICRDTDWYAIAKDGVIQETEILDQSNLHDWFAPFEKFAIENGLEPAGTQLKPRPEPSLINKAVVLRCNNCGWLGIFDKAFLEEKIHGKS